MEERADDGSTQFGVPTAALGRAWADGRPWELLTELTERGDRMGGHPGERRAADLVAAELEDLGAREVTVEGYDMTRWNRGTTALRLEAPVERSFEAVALPYSPAAEVRGDLVDVGHGTPEEIADADVEGAVVIASTDTPPDYGRFLHRTEKFGHAVEAGAVGFVFRNHVDGQLPPTGSLGVGRGEVAIPGVGVSSETGDWLVEYADGDGVGSLSVEASVEAGTGHNAHGVLGPESEREVVVVAHHDSHDVAEGALDNGCGVVTALTAARILAASDLGCAVRVVGVGGEELDLLGSRALAGSLDLSRVRAAVNVDGAGRFRTLRAFTHACDDLTPLVERVASAVARPVAVEDNVHPFSDHWPFLERGVPALQLHSERADVPAAATDPGRGRGRGFTHTRGDTRDKVDARNLREHGLLAALLVAALSREDVDRVPTETVADRLRDRNFERGMRAAGVWPAEWD